MYRAPKLPISSRAVATQRNSFSAAGRILRKAHGKRHADIHDLIAVPPLKYRQYSSSTFDTERKIVERELKRFSEFAGTALNQFAARGKIWELAKDYNLIDIFGESV